jgi:hypothetical protein
MLSCLKEIIPNAVEQATNQKSDNSDYSLIPEQTSEQIPQTSEQIPQTSEQIPQTSEQIPQTSEQTSEQILEQYKLFYPTNFSIYRNIETSQYKEPLLTNSSEP